jgi:hypothetical protein
MAVKTVTAEKAIGDLTVKLTSVSKSDAFARLKAALEYIASLPVDPGYGVDEGSKPDNSLPGSGGRPDNSLPGGGGRPDNSLPGGGEAPDNSLPGSGGRPDNSLPNRGGARPDNSLPDAPSTKPTPPTGGGEAPDQGLPGGGSGGAHPWLGQHVDEIAKAILKGTACDPDAAQPKR